MVCYFKHDPTSEHLKLCGAATRLFPPKTWILFFLIILCHPLRFSGIRLGCLPIVTAVGQRSSQEVCVEVTQEASGIFSALMSLGDTLTTMMKEFNTSLHHFSTLMFLGLLLFFLQIRSCFIKVSECYELKYLS